MEAVPKILLANAVCAVGLWLTWTAFSVVLGLPDWHRRVRGVFLFSLPWQVREEVKEQSNALVLSNPDLRARVLYVGHLIMFVGQSHADLVSARLNRASFIAAVTTVCVAAPMAVPAVTLGDRVMASGLALFCMQPLVKGKTLRVVGLVVIAVGSYVGATTAGDVRWEVIFYYLSFGVTVGAVMWAVALITRSTVIERYGALVSCLGSTTIVVWDSVDLARQWPGWIAGSIFICSIVGVAYMSYAMFDVWRGRLSLQAG